MEENHQYDGAGVEDYKIKESIGRWRPGGKHGKTRRYSMEGCVILCMTNVCMFVFFVFLICNQYTVMDVRGKCNYYCTMIYEAENGAL